MLMFIIVAAVNAQEVRDVETGRGDWSWRRNI